MLKNILKLNGVQELKNSNLQTINGGQFPYICWDSKGSFDSSINVSGDGVDCVQNTMAVPNDLTTTDAFA